MNGFRSLPLVLAAFALAGCPSISTMATARTIPEGTYQYAVTAGYSVLSEAVVNDEGRPEGVTAPGLELGVRYGLTDRIELGGRIFPVGAEAGAKLQVLRAPTTDRGLDLAVAPSLSVYPWSKGFAGWGNLSIPIGFNVGGNQLVIAPRGTAFLITSEEGTGKAFLGGGSMAFAVRVAGGRYTVLPEVAVLLPFSRSLPTDVEAQYALEGPLFQGSIGVLFGP